MTTKRSAEAKPLDDIMTKLKSNVRNLFNCKRVCGVCLNNTQNLRRGCTVYSISCGEKLSDKSLKEIIVSTFGDKIINLLPTCYFCESCIDVILQAYRMLKEIKFNHRILEYYTNKLMEQMPVQLLDDMQSIAFVLDYPNDSKLEDCKKDDNINGEAYVTFDYENEHKKRSLKSEILEEKQPKTVMLEIGEIMTKLRDQITFKRLRADSSYEGEDYISKTKKVSPKQKSLVRSNKISLNKKSKATSNAKNKRYYKCYLCGKTFTGERELLIHSRKLCLEPSPGENESSGRKMKTEQSNENISLVTNDSVDREICDQCGKLVASQYLKKHKKLHRDKQKQCPICDQFINKSAFKKHIDSHSSIPKLKYCNECNYETRFNDCLEAHINKVHLNIRPFTCDTCQKSFHSKVLLKEHIKIHTRIKTEQCDICGDRFLYKKSLVLHMRIHTGYKPYKCDLCDEAFLSASRRQIHKQSKHSGRNFQCDICSKRFFIRSTLRCHLLKVHGKKNKDKLADITELAAIS